LRSIGAVFRRANAWRLIRVFREGAAKEQWHSEEWLDRVKALPAWKHPYELMPGYPLNP